MSVPLGEGVLVLVEAVEAAAVAFFCAISWIRLLRKKANRFESESNFEAAEQDGDR